MSEYVSGVWMRSVDALREGEVILNDSLLKLRPWQLVVVSVCGTLVVLRLRRILRRSDRPIARRIRDAVLSLGMRLPSVQKKIDEQLTALRGTLEEQIHAADKKRIFLKELPDRGMTDDDILALADEYCSMGHGRSEVASGQVSGAVYSDCNDKQLMELQLKLYDRFAYSNPLHPMIFPDCRKMEAEVVRMVAALFHGDEQVRGTMTSGGTESILLAMYAYRNRALKNGVDEPQMLIPVTAHAAFDKAAVMFGIRLRHISVGEDGRVDVAQMERAISGDTCALVASAPNFPTGTVDDVGAVAQLGAKYGIPVHVDSCLGGFLVPFMEEAGHPLPLFDFRLPGVTSISCDMHKYGYAPKGSSLVLYRNADFLHHQFTCVPDWTGGVYATPTIAGSRSGLTIALTWATMLHIGREDYVSRTRQIVECTQRIAHSIRETLHNEGYKGLRVLGSSDVSVVAFQSDDVNVYAIGDAMSKMGWHLNPIQNPAGQHLCVTYNTVKARGDEAFVRDLRKVLDQLKDAPNKGNDSDTAVIYGTAETIPDKSVIDEVAFAYLDACYATPSLPQAAH